ncbi:kinase-like domain-containing protein, partial [Tribonema minus]
GKGASSTVWRCVDRRSGVAYAAKVIDLRPLKFRERFNVERLRREVNIMRKLHHPSIVNMENAFETEDQLILVLEFAQGVELFDAILARKRYSEDDARPVFLQVARALYYLHSMNVLHRDVKPENIMVRDVVSADGLFPEAKLLDFGLSKMVGEDMGSAARTFVGTPCYLAPEVEMRSRGQGGSYGAAVDCWSLGAVLYVMLAARFPEFTVLGGGRQSVRMAGPVWDGISDAAKALIRGLMAHDPTQRMTADQALRSVWATQGAPVPLPTVPLSLWG